MLNLLVVVACLGMVAQLNGFIFSKQFRLSPRSSFLRPLGCTADPPKAYDSEAITVLKGLEPVRKRPGMYIGSTGVKGLHHLVFEVVDNSVDEALAGHCTEIGVTLLADGSVEVVDNGRGIPCGMHPATGKSSLETVLCVLHAGGKFGGEDSGYKVSGGLHGVGISVVNALSSALTVDVVRDGVFHSMSFSAGEPQSALLTRPALPSEQRGTRVRFYPDSAIFKIAMNFEFDRLASRFDELAYLNAGLSISLTDQRTAQQMSFRHEGGITELVGVLCKDKNSLHGDVLHISKGFSSEANIAVEVALRWNKDQFAENLLGFANGIRTADGGSHLDGMKAAISKAVNQAAKKSGKLKEGSIPGEFIREGLTAVIAVKVPEPEFEGQTKTRLGNPEVRSAVDQVVSELMAQVADQHPATISAIVAAALEAQNAAIAAKAARDMVRRKSLLTSTVLPGKLSDCSSRDPAETEVYLVEGDSAAGSAKQGRDRRFQAILPLKGKILNIEKASNQKIYQNSELQALISALGLGVRGAPFDPAQLRYQRIIIMTDADVDGAHIRLLLLTFLFRYQRQLLEDGFVYIACPPLYKVSGGKKEQTRYFYSQEDYDAFLAEAERQPTSTQRFKGLGEMMPLELWETTMDPAKRTLKLVTVEDAVQSDALFSTLMGDVVAPRKDFIVKNAEQMALADLDY